MLFSDRDVPSGNLKPCQIPMMKRFCKNAAASISAFLTSQLGVWRKVLGKTLLT